MPVVTLAPVDDAVLAALTRVAVADAAADEETPPQTSDGQWSAERVAWFEGYHRACRAGLSGSRREAVWAVLVDGSPRARPASS